MKHFLTGAALALALTRCSAGNAQRDHAQLGWSRDTLIAQLELVRDLADPAARGDLLTRPRSVRAARGYLFVTDAGSDRVAVLDSSAALLRWVGAHGSGPGKRAGISHLAVRDTTILVGEALNGRVSEFTFGGRFLRTYAAPFGAGALSTTVNAAFAASRSVTHYAAELGDDVSPALAFERAHQSHRTHGAGPNGLAGHDLIAADSNGVWVFDQASVSICRYRAVLAPGRCISLPRELATRLRVYTADRVARLEASVHMHVEAAPLAKDMIVAGAWLALLLPLPEEPIALVDGADGSVTPVLFTGDSMPDWARAARSFAWDGHAFVVVSEQGIGRIYLSRRINPE